MRNPAISISDMEIWYQEALVILSFNSRCISKYSAMQRDMAGQQAVRTTTQVIAPILSLTYDAAPCCCLLAPPSRCALPSGAHAAARNSHCRWVTAKTETTLRVHAGSYSPLFGEACTAALEAGGSAADCWTCDWGLIFVWIRAYFLWNLNLGLISWISMK